VWSSQTLQGWGDRRVLLRYSRSPTERCSTLSTHVSCHECCLVLEFSVFDWGHVIFASRDNTWYQGKASCLHSGIIPFPLVVENNDLAFSPVCTSQCQFIFDCNSPHPASQPTNSRFKFGWQRSGAVRSRAACDHGSPHPLFVLLSIFAQ